MPYVPCCRSYSSVIIDSASRNFKPISLAENPFRPFDLSGHFLIQGKLCNVPEFGVLVAVSDGSTLRVWDVVSARSLSPTPRCHGSIFSRDTVVVWRTESYRRCEL